MHTDQIQGYELSPRQRDRALAGGGHDACRLLHAALRFDGACTAAALSDALHDLVAEHEILRTRFEKVPGMALPLQVIDPAPDALPVPQSNCDPSALPERFAAWCAQDEHAVAFHLLTLDQGDLVLLLRLPMLVADGATVTNIAAYLRDHLDDCLPDQEPLQYVDLADWLAEQLNAPENAAGHSYQRRMAQAPVTPLTTPWRRAISGKKQGFTPAECVAGCWPSTLPETEAVHYLFAAWALLLWRHGGAQRQRLYYAFDGRRFDDLRDALGPLEQLLPVDLDISPTQTWPDLAAQARSTLNQAIQAAASFQLSEPVAMDALFRYQPAPHLSSPQTRVNVVAERGFPQPFGLQLTVQPAAEGWHLSLAYDTARYHGDDVAWLGGRLHDLLAILPQAANNALTALRCLQPSEAQPPAAPESDQNHDLFAAFTVQAKARPDHPALLWGDRSYSYAQLAEAAARLAGALRGRFGVGSEDLVALCCERAPAMVIAVLAVHQCGAAFVPLDPDQPPQRLAAVAAQVRLTLCLTDAKTRDRCGAMKTPLADIETLIAAAEPMAIKPKNHGQNLAYAIATSGSTGAPKLVGIPCEGLANRIFWMQQHYRLTPDAVVLQKTPLCFDVSLWELFWPLCHGATLALAPHDGHRDPAVLAETIQRHRVTHMHFVPSMLQAFLQETRPGLASLRLVIAGGEAVTPAMQQRFYAALPHARLEQSYGPTETSIAVCAHPVAADCDETPIPIGRCIDATAAYVLDDQMQAVVAGRSGELYLAGVCLARGYLGRGDLTAAAFVPNPFGPPGTRLYRTGDMALRRPDGNLVFIARRDHQIKLRGYRIELGEIEQVLQQHARVHAAVVDLYRHDSGDQLTAWIVADDASESDLRRHLEAHLPHYMVPTHFVALPQLPLTVNGKCDRRALPAPSAASGDIEPARNAAESALCRIWHELLPQFDGHIHRNFFDCGGHSLLATRVIAQARDLFKVSLSVRHMFEAPTVARLAALIADLQHSTQAPSAPITAAPAGAITPLSFAQQRLWFLQACAPDSSAYNIPAALLLRGPLDRAALSAALEQLQHRHPILRTRYHGDEQATVQIVDEPGPLQLSFEDLRHDEQRETRCRQRIEQAAGAPFDLAHDQPMRCLLLRKAEDEHVLVVTLHHIACDGWSSSLLIRELGENYRRHLAGKAPPPPLSLHYSDFAYWQRSPAGAAELAQQRDYWRRQLADAPEPLRLPADFRRPTVAGENGALLRFSLPNQLVADLEALARRHEATLYMTLLAGFKWWLNRRSGCRDLLVGTPSAGRNRAELENMIGLFVNTLVIRSQVSPNQSFTDWLGEIKNTTLTAFAHQDVPFEQLVEVLQPQRRLDTTPLFQVMFVLQNTPDGHLALPNLSLEPLEVPRHSARFDLTLSVSEHADRVQVSLEYRTDLWQAATITRWWGEIETLLTQIAADPHKPLAQHPLDLGLAVTAQAGADSLTLRDTHLDRTLLADDLKQRCRAEAVHLQLFETEPAQLAAYVIGAAPDIDPAQVKNAVNAALPVAAKLNHLVFVDSLPETAEPPPLATDYVAPATTMEQDVVALWQEALAVEPVGLHDDFWELGGCPDAARALTETLAAHFAQPVTLADLTEHPTVAALSAWLLTQLSTGDETALAALLDQLENEDDCQINSKTMQTQEFPGNDRILVEE